MATLLKNEKNFELKFDEEYQEGFDGQLNLAEGSVVNLAELARKEEQQNSYTTTIRVGGKDYPVLSKETPAYLARHILNHNKLHGFTLVTLIGKSGTGKSTITRTLTHYLHTMAEKKFDSIYVPQYYRQRDIENIDNIIGGLEKGINRILNFEDASFTFNYSDTADIEEVMRRLTYVRHTLQARIIVMIQIHYAKALEKFLRDGDVKIITSITDEEKENLFRLFGWDAKPRIKNYAMKYHSMETNGFWYSDVSMTKVLYHKTHEPFRLALVSDFGKLHNMVYHAVECPYCSAKFEEPKNTTFDTYNLNEFLKQLFGSYTKSRVRGALKDMLYWKEGLDTLEPRTKYVIHRITEFFGSHPDEYKAFIEEIRTGKSVDMALRNRGIIEGRKTREEQRKERTLNQKRVKALRKKLLEQPPTKEGLEAVGVPTMEAGPTSDEDIADTMGDNIN